ncbi:MAG TPA: hypothetical protein DF911_00420 [Erysipelotrichaceae bacterium]|nr:hypothetical protein [Erysipelotrichaceae bacterium]
MTRILFISNYLNQHQLPLCNAFLNRGVDFHFIAMERTPASRLAGGYADMNEQYPFVVKGYEDGFDVEQWIDQADAVVVGGFLSNPVILSLCNTNNIPFFYYSEHLYKRGKLFRYHPRAVRFVREHFLDYKNNPNFRVLCASSYLSKDLALWHFPTEKCLKWGYFPSVEKGEGCPEDVDRDVDILWAGRMLDWKHPEDLITIVEHRKEENKPVHAVLIGDGPEKEKMEHQISRLGLEQQIQVLGARPYTEVYQWMKRSKIFLFSSDHHEGWGAVLNEAMQSGCACLAAKEAGSTNWLIQDGETGLIYDHGMHHKAVLLSKADQLLDNEEMCHAIARQGRDEINTLWNADYAVSELLKFLDNPRNQPERGPVSAA